MKGTPVRATEWAARLAARLRLVQASFADDSPETRERTLRDEVEQALKTVALGQRKECIEALAMEFPVPESGKQNGADGHKTGPATVPEEPAVLVERVIGLMQAMPPDERESIVAQFVAAGLLPAGNGATADISEELTRVESHLAQFAHHLRRHEPVGRTLEFITQEIFRELNTLGAKANDAAHPRSAGPAWAASSCSPTAISTSMNGTTGAR